MWLAWMFLHIHWVCLRWSGWLPQHMGGCKLPACFAQADKFLFSDRSSLVFSVRTCWRRLDELTETSASYRVPSMFRTSCSLHASTAAGFRRWDWQWTCWAKWYWRLINAAALLVVPAPSFIGYGKTACNDSMPAVRREWGFQWFLHTIINIITMRRHILIIQRWPRLPCCGHIGYFLQCKELKWLTVFRHTFETSPDPPTEAHLSHILPPSTTIVCTGVQCHDSFAVELWSSFV